MQALPADRIPRERRYKSFVLVDHYEMVVLKMIKSVEVRQSIRGERQNKVHWLHIILLLAIMLSVANLRKRQRRLYTRGD
jgi:hypothetical protein